MTTQQPHQLLSAAADWIQADPARWGTDWFINPDTCQRCTAGVLVVIADPKDEDGDPQFVPAADAAVGTLADYLVTELGVVEAGSHNDGWQPEPVETVGAWNDAPGRTWMEVVAALRDAARHTAPACSGCQVMDVDLSGDGLCPDCSLRADFVGGLLPSNAGDFA